MAAKVKFDQVKVGDEIPQFKVQVNRTDFVRYAGASGDFNPNHHDQTFAENAGLPTVFGMGNLTGGFLSKCVTDYVGIGQLRSFRVRFLNRVWPDDQLTCRGKITNKVEKDGEKLIEGNLEVVNQKGEVNVSGAFRAATS